MAEPVGETHPKHQVVDQQAPLVYEHHLPTLQVSPLHVPAESSDAAVEDPLQFR